MNSFEELSRVAQTLAKAHQALKQEHAELQESHRLAVAQAQLAAERLEVLKLSLGSMMPAAAMEHSHE